MDVQRAVAILNRAAENRMYDATKIPESDADKITAAEQQVQLCEQVEQVVHGAFPGVTDERIIAQSVPHWPGVVKILAEAKVFVGSNGPPSTPRQIAVEEPTIPDSPKATEQIVDADAQDPDPLAVVKPDPPAPQGPNRSEPSKGEVWLDSQGNAWEVVSYYGGQSAEVRNVASGEPTIVPTGFLKRRHQTETPLADQLIKQATDSARMVLDAVQPEATDPSPPPQDPTDDGHEPLSSAPVEDHSTETPEIPTTSAAFVTYEEDAAGEKAQAGVMTAEYDALVDEIERRYAPSGMPIPRDLEDPPSIDAESFADVDDKVARILHGKYNALAARAKYLHDVEDAIARRCKLRKLRCVRNVMKPLRSEYGKTMTLTEIKAIAEEVPDVIEWDEYVQLHEDEARAYRTFHDIYAEHVKTLSRDWSMREAQVR